MSKVRIQEITIENYKNVRHGSIDLSNKVKGYRASVLGIYGQNGSGKTALIDALKILKLVLSGRRVFDLFIDNIHVEAKKATFKFKFSIDEEEDHFDVWYSFDIVEEKDVDRKNIQIADECLSFAYQGEKQKIRKSVLIDTDTKNVFVPKSRYHDLCGKIDATDMLVNKKLSAKQSMSFIFARETMKIFDKNCKNPIYLKILNDLANYGKNQLFVVGTESNGLITLNTLPLPYMDDNSGHLLLPLNKPAIIATDLVPQIEKIINSMNIVLQQIIPNLTLGVTTLGNSLMENGQMGTQIQLISYKTGKAIPFSNESDGIKKIVSILQLMIMVFNRPSITVAIDELDSGIYEYLLGELLMIISEQGKGQLIFTSHNLRPLETINHNFIAFTSTDQDNRYVRFSPRRNLNLRDIYYRDIILSEEKEAYDGKDNYEIAMAFKEAGELFE
jgi:AAA15 family ATPase/GTPase